MSEMARDGVFLNNDGTLDEVCGYSVYLEHMNRNQWFLLVGHKDGTETAIWFGSKDLKRPLMEKREPRPAVPVEKHDAE